MMSSIDRARGGGTARRGLLLAIMCTLALGGLAGCTVKVSTSGSGTSPGEGGTSGGEALPAEVHEEIAGARVELSSVKEDLTQLAQAGQDIPEEALNAILARLEQAEAQLEEMLKRAEAMESGGHDHDEAAEHDGHDHDG